MFDFWCLNVTNTGFLVAEYYEYLFIYRLNVTNAYFPVAVAARRPGDHTLAGDFRDEDFPSNGGTYPPKTHSATRELYFSNTGFDRLVSPMP